jgi:hypothetical protein
MNAKIDWTDTPDSANVARVFYHADTKTIGVQFCSGGLYSYLGASEEIYENLVHAPSVGGYLHDVVKAFPYTRWENEDALMDYLNVSKNVQPK